MLIVIIMKYEQGLLAVINISNQKPKNNRHAQRRETVNND